LVAVVDLRPQGRRSNGCYGDVERAQWREPVPDARGQDGPSALATVGRVGVVVPVLAAKIMPEEAFREAGPDAASTFSELTLAVAPSLNRASTLSEHSLDATSTFRAPAAEAQAIESRESAPAVAEEEEEVSKYKGLEDLKEDVRTGTLALVATGIVALEGAIRGSDSEEAETTGGEESLALVSGAVAGTAGAAMAAAIFVNVAATAGTAAVSAWAVVKVMSVWGGVMLLDETEETATEEEATRPEPRSMLWALAALRATISRLALPIRRARSVPSLRVLGKHAVTSLHRFPRRLAGIA